MNGLNVADIWERIADLRASEIALVHGPRRVGWPEFERRAGGVSTYLMSRGAQRDDKVAMCLYNDPAYLESVFACFKSSLVPVNTNYRYTDDELVYLWDNADAVAVVFHGVFAEAIERIRGRLPGVRTWLWVDDGTSPCPPWAMEYEVAAATEPASAGARSGRDQLFIYTGGTTGRPKGVMWEQDSLIRLVLADAVPLGDDATADEIAARGGEAVPGPCVVACPLMHATGLVIAMIQLLEGGALVTLPDRAFDAERLLDTIERERAERLVIVGDAFAKPIVAALDAHPDRWDLSSLGMVASSGVMWSEPVKQRLLDHHSGMVLLDSLGSSEALGIGVSMSVAGSTASTARFTATELAVVVDDRGRPIQPGSGEVGRLGMFGITPVGYYKDPERSAATFPVVDGVRYSLPGDWARVDADGTIVLLGRGSVCINTGGEKVFPEEVEEVLKTHPSVADAVVVGVPDDRFGEAVTAVVEPAPGVDVDESELVATARSCLAAFKAPRRVVTIDTIGRGPNGKVDYPGIRQYAIERLGVGVGS